MPSCRYVHQACAWCQQGSEDSVRHPWTGVTDSRKLPFGWWVLNLGPLQEQYTLFSAEPSSQSQWLSFDWQVDDRQEKQERTGDRTFQSHTSDTSRHSSDLGESGSLPVLISPTQSECVHVLGLLQEKNHTLSYLNNQKVFPYSTE